MTKVKRMSDILASSSEQDVTMISPTPPYSSEGPTLPIIDAQGISELTTKITDPNKPASSQTADKTGRNGAKGRDTTTTQISSETRPTATVHPTLYEPWKLLPPELLGILESQSRLRGAENIAPVVFTKNQNVKSGINRLKAYLGAYKDGRNPIDMPKSLNLKDAVIAISAQGDGTAKLVSIVDMTKRILLAAKGDEKDTDTWYMYLALASIVMERQHASVEQNSKITQDTQDMQAEAFEPNEHAKHQPKPKKVPVLTIWITKRAIPVFQDAFGEHSFAARKLAPQDTN